MFYLDGKTKDRIDVVNRFESADEGIFLISIKAGGVGLNLVSAQDVIIYDPWWNPFVEQQAVDRAYRIGQDKPVTVYKLVVANTIEERIVEMQKHKENDFDELINGISTNKNIDLKDIIELLK
jgi:SNF2 family DNA or RNA helicase